MRRLCIVAATAIGLALGQPALAQDLAPDVAAEIRGLAEAALTERLADASTPFVLLNGESAAPLTDLSDVVFIGVTALPAKEGEPRLVQAQFYRYADAVLFQVVVNLETQNVTEISGLRPGNPRLAAEERVRAAEIAGAAPEVAAILEQFPDAVLDFGVATIGDPNHPRMGHRLIRLLFHRDRQYLSIEPLFVDLTEGEVLTRAELGIR